MNSGMHDGLTGTLLPWLARRLTMAGSLDQLRGPAGALNELAHQANRQRRSHHDLAFCLYA